MPSAHHPPCPAVRLHACLLSFCWICRSSGPDDAATLY
ncbi:uncharacterized protein BCN122_III0847 [Burkholderia cenocepacia]|nr:uncharacterized protein BCN122_III0847 [Burkholderia cenocepacia]